MKRLLLFACLCCASLLVSASESATKSSPHSVADMVDKLAHIVSEKGFSVIDRVYHAAVAKSAGLELLPTPLSLSGSRNLGTQLFTGQRSISVDLPVRVLMWEEPDGMV